MTMFSSLYKSFKHEYLVLGLFNTQRKKIEKQLVKGIELYRAF